MKGLEEVLNDSICHYYIIIIIIINVMMMYDDDDDIRTILDNDLLLTSLSVSLK